MLMPLSTMRSALLFFERRGRSERQQDLLTNGKKHKRKNTNDHVSFYKPRIHPRGGGGARGGREGGRHREAKGAVGGYSSGAVEAWAQPMVELAIVIGPLRLVYVRHPSCTPHHSLGPFSTRLHRSIVQTLYKHQRKMYDVVVVDS